MAIGKARIKDIKELTKWLSKEENMSWIYNINTEGVVDNKEFRQIAGNLYVNEYDRKQWHITNEKEVEEFRRVAEYAQKTGIPFQLLAFNKDVALIKYGRTKYLIPAEHVEINEYEDYLDTPLGLLRDKGSMEKEFQVSTAGGQETARTAYSKIEEKKKEIEDAQKKINNLNEEKRQELQKLKMELEMKFQEKREILERKMREIEEVKEAMEKELFMLETEIYGIRCFMGEVIDFTQIRTGKKADIQEPVIVHQKVRYLDEELGKLISIYEFDGNDKNMFEEYIACSDFGADFFAPGEKSVSLVKISRNEKGYVTSAESQSMLDEYDKLHGGMMGIIIRNGENIYLGWADEEKISLKEENLYYAPGKREYQTVGEDKEKLTNTSKEEVASRYFIFSLLQGIINDGRILAIPENESVMKGGGKYIVFSRTEGYIEDNRFGNFSDIMDRCNTNFQEGDMILCVKMIFGSHNKNERGIGYNNRTWDCNLENNKIYPINKIEKQIKSVIEYKTYKGPELPYRSHGTMLECKFTDRAWILEEKKEERKKCYVSIAKRLSVNNARANFMLYSDEIVNLTFLNSVWVKYAIQNKKVGSWCIGGQCVDYAYSIRYLNKILEYLKRREAEEESLISMFITLPEEWQVLLSEWKLEKNVHKITEYQAKRFAKHLQKINYERNKQK